MWDNNERYIVDFKLKVNTVTLKLKVNNVTFKLKVNTVTFKLKVNTVTFKLKVKFRVNRFLRSRVQLRFNKCQSSGVLFPNLRKVVESNTSFEIQYCSGILEVDSNIYLYLI